MRALSAGRSRQVLKEGWGGQDERRTSRTSRRLLVPSLAGFSLRGAEKLPRSVVPLLLRILRDREGVVQIARGEQSRRQSRSRGHISGAA